jgi:hypothetical protein
VPTELSRHAHMYRCGLMIWNMVFKLNNFTGCSVSISKRSVFCGNFRSLGVIAVGSMEPLNLIYLMLVQSPSNMRCFRIATCLQAVLTWEMFWWCTSSALGSAISYTRVEYEKFPHFSEVNFALVSEIDCTVRGSHYGNMETCWSVCSVIL